MPEQEIVVFNRDIPAGVSTILKNIIRYKPVSTTDYKLVLYHFKGSNRPRITENWCENVVRIELSRYDNLYHSLRKIKEYVNEHSILVANDVLELRLAALLKLKNPLIYIVHGDFETYYKQCDVFQDYMDVIICYSRHIFEKLSQRLKNANRDKLKLLYYPVQHISPGEIPGGSLKIAFAGSLIYRKGIDTVPTIVSHLDGKNVDYRLEIIGSGEMEQEIKEAFKKNGRVVFRGQLTNEEVIKTLQQNHVLLFPTRSEGLPNVLIEAMKAGCVPVASHIPSGIPDIVESEGNGVLVSPGDIDGFANALIRLASDRSNLTRLSSNAIRTASEMFNAERNAKNYFDTFVMTSKKNQVPNTSVHPGRVLNRPWLPNILVRGVRKLNISPKL